ncbi:MAG: hydroxyacid dehydrogenase [Candidatus Woesearchaeota archaeon]
MNITFFELEDWEKEYVRKELKGNKILFIDRPLDKKIAKKIDSTEIAACFIYSKINKDVIKALPLLKFISTMSTGYDHIDLEECKNKKVKVCNVPTYGENTVAEHTFALILSLSRKVPESIERTKKGNFSLDGIRGFDLKDKTLGVIGSGNIGQHVIRIAKGFEMNVICSDPIAEKKPEFKKLAKKIGFKFVSLNDLMKKSDILTLHCPHNKYTHHLINKKNINHLKKGVYIVNTARGELIETEALLEGLKKGIIAGAGLDVLEGENYIREEKQLLHKKFQSECDLNTIYEDHMLISQDNVLITPHNAFNSKEALYRILDTTIENIKAFVKKKKLVNEVKV